MKKMMFLGFYFISPLFMIRVLYGINPDKYSNLSILLAMCIGVAAYNWFIWQFILSARPKFLDVMMGLDKIYRLHGIMAIVAIVLALGHNLILEGIFGESLGTFLGGLALWIYVGVSMLSLVVLTKQKWMKVRLLAQVAGFLSKIKSIKYEHFKWFHNLSFFGLLLMQMHVLMTSNARNYRTVFNMYMIYFLSALVFYLYHKLLRPWLIKENKWQVEEIAYVADQVCDIKMKSVNHKLKYKPGQFGFFKIKGEKGYEEHPFSFTSTSLESNKLSITVKALGDFTGGIYQLKKGDIVYLDGPYGNFSYLNYPDEKKTFFIAGGVGITPVISMIRYMSQVEPNRMITLLWGMRREKDYMYQEEFGDLMMKMPNLSVIPVMSDEKNFNGEKGFIDYYTLLKYVNPSEYYNKKVGFYICGPKILMENSRRNLQDLGISFYRIHYESFSF